ncbi:hypothetical protein EON62_04600 [archaeon]|nr:MAG: hypothetical protein EON62_04600 [archaeon]
MQITCASSRALVGQDVLAALGVTDATAAVVPGLTVSDVSPADIAYVVAAIACFSAARGTQLAACAHCERATLQEGPHAAR